MENLNKYIVPVNLIVFGESEEDALQYAEEAVEHSDLLDQDGIIGIDPTVEIDDIELYEE
jgi:hypothetical protein